MDNIDFNSWTQIVNNYGPPAIFVISLMGVVWAAKQFPAAQNVLTRYVFAGVFLSFFICSVVLGGYIVVTWKKPTIVYYGSLGMHNDSVKFVPASDGAYIAQEVHGSNAKWKFIIISDTTYNLKDCYYFSYYIDGKYIHDLEIESGHLKQGALLLHVDPSNQQKFLYDDNTPVLFVSNSKTDANLIASNAPHGWFSAYAQAVVTPADVDQTVRLLNSPNEFSRANAGNMLRALNAGQLQDLLKRQDLSGEAKQRASVTLMQKLNSSSGLTQ